MDCLQIRMAIVDDLPAINAIYNHYVLHSTCTYQETPETEESRLAWFQSRSLELHPVIVAEEAGAILGWAALAPFRTRSAYRFTVEASIYLHPDFLGRGLGTMLLRELIRLARAAGYHSIMGGASADQTASVAVQEKLGFQRVALYKEVGYKFGKWLDVIYLQLMLNDPSS
jgi:L-amino acid N-acyltransferase YncA